MTAWRLPFAFLLLLSLATPLVCCLATDEANWKLLAPQPSPQTSSPLPTARSNQCSVYVPSTHKVYVFGGNDGIWEFQPLNDLWVFDLATLAWSQVTPVDVTANATTSSNMSNRKGGSLPSKRFRHACIYDEATHSLWVFGGMAQPDPDGPALALDDLWQFDLDANVWREVEPEGKRPSPRYFHVAALEARQAGALHALDDDNDGDDAQGQGGLMVVFGGMDDRQRYNELWKYDIANNAWRQVKPATSFTPPALSNSAARATADGQYLYIFGGQRWWGYQGIINSVFRCHLPTGEWEEVLPSKDDDEHEEDDKGGDDGVDDAATPEPRVGASVVLVDGGRSLLVFGGYNVDGFYTNDLRQLNLETRQWRRVEAAGKSVPPRRYAHSAMPIQGEAFDQMLVFGGYSDYVGETRNFDDLWQLTLTLSRA